MLSRLALAPRAGFTAAKLVRHTNLATPSVRAAAAPTSVWGRLYSKKTDKTPDPFNTEGKDAPASKATSSQDSSAEPTSTQQDAAAESAKHDEQIPFDKLPDLTQGIPSTLAQEMAEKSGNRQPSYLQTVDEEYAGDREKRDPYDSYVSTNERNRRWWTRFMMGTVLAGSLSGVVYMGRNWDDAIDVERHPDIPNGWGVGLWWQRAHARMTESLSYYQDPAFDKLLPDKDPSFARPYTLCLSLDDLLVHSEWSREHGWRVAKRPGMDYFVRYLSQYYELVLFTTVPFAMGEPLVRKLDPFRFIMWPLFREATKYEEGEVVKDLSYLNRDLSKVIIIDTEAKHVRKHPENAIILDPWKGQPNDNGLVGLIPFLEYIHTMEYNDVRKVLKSFEGKDIPKEFARREAIMRKEFNARNQAQKHSKPSGMAALGNALGLKSSNMSMTMQPEGEQSTSEAFAQGKMLQDIARERGQRNYEMMDKEIRENGEKWLKEEAAMMEKAQQEAMSSMVGSFGGWFGGNKGDGEQPKK